MTPIEKEEQRLFEKNIIIQEHSLPSNKVAMCAIIKTNNKTDNNFPKAIFYDANKLPTMQHKRTAILHEEMHLEHPETMYSLDDCYAATKSKERKVKRLLIKEFIPKELLFKKLYIEKKQKFEISEELCISEDLIEYAYNLYSSSEDWIIKKEKINNH